MASDCRKPGGAGRCHHPVNGCSSCRYGNTGSTTREGGEGWPQPSEAMLAAGTRAVVAASSSPDAPPDRGEAEWITLRSLESDPRHLVVEVGGREVINTYFADGPVYHTAHPSSEAPANHRNIHGEPIPDVPLTPYADPEAPANRQEAGEVERAIASARSMADLVEDILGWGGAPREDDLQVAYDQLSHDLAALTFPKDVKGGGR